jgi:thiaminase
LQTTLHQYLKESTRSNHNAAEAHPFQGTLANGKLPRGAYVDYVQQLSAMR